MLELATLQAPLLVISPSFGPNGIAAFGDGKLNGSCRYHSNIPQSQLASLGEE